MPLGTELIEVNELSDCLEGLGWRTYAYSGRGMYGKQCLAINVDDLSEVWFLAMNLGKMDWPMDLSAPKWDNMGHGFVVYWPDVPFKGEGA